MIEFKKKSIDLEEGGLKPRRRIEALKE